MVAGRRHFIPAVWANQTHVTLALSIDCNQLADMNPITEFCDLVPSHYLPIIPSLEIKMMQGKNWRILLIAYGLMSVSIYSNNIRATTNAS